MYTRTTPALCLSVLGMTLILGTSACRKESTDSTASAGAPATGAKAADLPAEVTAKLAKADALDGATDHVVSKCGMCNLRMPGSDAHKTMIGDYELHFCSDHCKESFDKDANKAVLAFKIDE